MATSQTVVQTPRELAEGGRQAQPGSPSGKKGSSSVIGGGTVSLDRLGASFAAERARVENERKKCRLNDELDAFWTHCSSEEPSCKRRLSCSEKQWSEGIQAALAQAMANLEVHQKELEKTMEKEAEAVCWENPQWAEGPWTWKEFWKVHDPKLWEKKFWRGLKIAMFGDYEFPLTKREVREITCKNY